MWKTNTSTNRSSGTRRSPSNLFERLIIEKPHPWGILFLLDKLFTDRRYNFETSTFYQKNSQIMENLITYVLDFVKISEAGNQGEEELAAIN